MAHITTADIRHRHIRKFSPADKQSYVDSANARFDAYADALGVPPADIPAFLPNTITDFILADMYMQIALDNVGSEGNLIGEANLYQTMYALYNDQYAKLKPLVTKNAILGSATSISASAVSFGVFVRG